MLLSKNPRRRWGMHAHHDLTNAIAICLFRQDQNFPARSEANISRTTVIKFYKAYDDIGSTVIESYKLVERKICYSKTELLGQVSISAVSPFGAFVSNDQTYIRLYSLFDTIGLFFQLKLHYFIFSILILSCYIFQSFRPSIYVSSSLSK